MGSIYVLLLLSVFVANVTLGVVGDDRHDGATSMTRRSTIAVAINDEQIQRVNQERRRGQQQTLNYRANYTADFQRIVHPSCTGDQPVLAIGCYGEKMEILNVSHPSIQCVEQKFDAAFEGPSYICTNSCTEDDACASIYTVNDSVRNAFDGPHGSIQFFCEGNTTQGVNAIFLFSSAIKTGTCSADSTADIQSNLRVVRLGLSCPSGDDFSGVEQTYVYDDTFFECAGNTNSGDTASSPNDAYTCFSGKDCEGKGCNFTFSQTQVLTHASSFANECVQARVPIDGYPTPAPQAETSLYRVRFEASWSTIYNDTVRCDSNSDSIHITCDSNGGSTIAFVTATDPNMNCINVEENVLQCSGDSTQSLNIFTTVAYDCFSLNIPLSTVTYPESYAFCENNDNDTYISNWVSLGIMCNNSITSIDLYFECSDSRHDFINLDDPYNLVGLRYLCSEGTIIDNNSLASNVYVIPNVSITTDEYWQNKADASCYGRSSDTSRPPVTIPVPTLAPKTATASPEPDPTMVTETKNPVMTPSVVPDLVSPMTSPEFFSPMAAPRSPPNLFPPAPIIPANDTFLAPSQDDSKNENNNVLIIGAVGGVVGGIIISVLLFIVYNKGKNDGVAENKDEAFPPEKDHNDTDNNTESHHSPSIPQSSNQTDSGSPSIITATALASPIETTTSGFYEVHYKDQSRSVIGIANGRTHAGGNSDNKEKTPVPVLARHYKAENVKNPKPTSGIEIPTVTAIMCNDISMLGESDSSIRRLADSNSSLRMAGASNPSFRKSSASNSSIPTEPDRYKINSYMKKEPPTSSILADSNSSLRMIGEFNNSFHILDDSSSTIPTESNTFSNDYNRKKPALADPDSSFRMDIESFHDLEDSNSTIPTESDTLRKKYNRTTETLEDSNSSLKMVGESNRSFHILHDSNSTIRTDSNADSNAYVRKKPTFPSSALEL